MIKAIVPKLAGITADVWVSERHKREVEVTKNPVESGSQVADHGFLKPRELSITFGVSNTPLRDNQSFEGYDRIGDARNKLEAMQAQLERLTVNTITGGIYENCLITSITWDTDKKNPQAIIFDIELEEILIVNTRLTQYEPMPSDDDLINQASTTKKRGEAAVKPLAPVADIRRNFTPDASTDADRLAKSEAAKAQAEKLADSEGRSMLKALARKDPGSRDK